MTNPTSTADFLIELGTEELPANQLEKLRDHFTAALNKQLEIHGLVFQKTQSFITPRRLAVLVSELSTQQPTQKILRKGPAKNAAYDEKGNPTKAALGFAGSCGVPFEDLTLQETEQGAWFIYEQTKAGESTEKLLPTILTEAFKNLPLGRQMRWGSNDYSFLRPIHWIVLLLGIKTIECELFGIKSSNITYGHRFHSPQPLEISAPKEYEALLETKGHVIPSFEKRREKISDALMKAAPQNTFINNDLLDEVTGIVEWPVVLIGNLNPEFLKIPQEVLITSMQNHQKCFPVGDKNHKLLSQFLIVSNIDSRDPIQVIAGNESVIGARLADAAFFYEVDKKSSLDQFREGLKNVRFQQGLGTLWDKSERIAELAEIIAKMIGADPKSARRAAELCKADLLTQMVGEFPELQGIMGFDYLEKNEPIVAKAIKEHYWPKVFSTALSSNTQTSNKEVVLNSPLGGESRISPIGQSVALADRIDNLVGLFGLGKQPTGDKDPFALRRQALETISMLMRDRLDLDLMELLTDSLKIYNNQIQLADKTQDILDFCFERSRAICPWGTSTFDAALSKKPTNPWDFILRLYAVSEIQNSIEFADNFASLAAANKRVKNILSKSENAIPKDSALQTSLLQEEAEKTLEKQLSLKEKELVPLLKNRKYKEALQSLSSLKEPIDHFFDTVMVMVENEDLRNNRLRLLNRLRELFLTIADISLL